MPESFKPGGQWLLISLQLKTRSTRRRRQSNNRKEHWKRRFWITGVCHWHAADATRKADRSPDESFKFLHLFCLFKHLRIPSCAEVVSFVVVNEDFLMLYYLPDAPLHALLNSLLFALCRCLMPRSVPDHFDSVSFSHKGFFEPLSCNLSSRTCDHPVTQLVLQRLPVFFRLPPSLELDPFELLESSLSFLIFPTSLPNNALHATNEVTM